jgi:hypothetical protein
MESLDQPAPIEDAAAWMAQFSADLVALMSLRPTSQNVAQDNLAILQSVHEAGRSTYDSMLCYISASHGLHAACQAARSAGDEQWAKELHEMAQLFLQYAAGDIETIVAGHANAIVAAAAVHNRVSVH